MTTVPKADTPAPPNGARTLTVGDDGSHAYGRPTAGNNADTVTSADGGGTVGPSATDSDAPAGAIPDIASAYAVNWAGAPVDTGDTQTGPNIGHGATQLVPQPDATGHPAGDASGGGTVGDSGSQPGSRVVAAGEL